MSSIPVAFHDLLMEKPAYATLTTMLPDGLPHMTLVWIGYDPESDRILVNTERGRRKEKNARNDPRAGVLVVDPDSYFRYLSVAGEVTRFREEGARDHIDELARRYTDADEYQNPIQTGRIVLEIRPDEVFTVGG